MNTRLARLVKSSSTIAIITSLSSLAAIAQPAESPAFGLEEIIVTAQKRSENLQSVPVSITAFSEAMLERSGITGVEEVASRTPNLKINRSNLAEPQIYVRGVGSNSDSAAGDPTVGVFLDEVYVGRAGSAAFDLFDLERIEVLRGPQGTLDGRNTSGGAINIITKKPSEDTYVKLYGSYGNYNSIEARVTANTALSDKLYGKISLNHRSHDGYSKNMFTGDELMDEENWSGRLQFLFMPSDNTRILLTGDYSKDDNGGNARVPYIVPSTSPIAPFIRNAYPADTDVRLSAAFPESFQKRESWGATLRIDHDASYGTWTSLTAYRKYDLSWLEDLGTPSIPKVLRNDDSVAEDARQFSQELRLASSPDSRVKWVLGLYYFNEKVDRSERFITEFLLVPAAGGDVTFGQNVKSESFAAFGQVTVPLGDAFSITGGLRWTYDKKDAHQTAVNNNPLDPTPGIPLFPGQPYDITADANWDALTGRVALEYKDGDGPLLFASISRGYKSGIFASQNNIAANVGIPIKPEYAWTYEVGFKSDLLDNKLRLNGTAFYTDYKDLQLFRLDAQLRLVTFNADAEIYGGELEAVAILAPGLELGGNVAYLHTEMTTGDFIGNELTRAPKWTTNIYGSYSFAVPGGDLSLRADYRWTGRYTMETTNLPETYIENFGLWDARIAYTHEASGLEVALWGKNLTDKDYPVHLIPFLGSSFAIYGTPRTYGLSLSYRWGE